MMARLVASVLSLLCCGSCAAITPGSSGKGVSIAAGLNNAMRANPFKTSVIVTTVKAGVADLMVQRLVERREQVDKRRLVTFLIFGCVYQGCFQYCVINLWLEKLFPGRSLLQTTRKIAAVNFIADPVFFFPCFYTLKEALARYAQCSTDILSLDTLRAAFSKYSDNCLADWRNTWATWIPGHCMTYGVLPMHLRMPWVAAMSFGYLSLLSFTRG